MSAGEEERLLLVFARYPEAGAVKTRLIPALGAEGAAALQRAMVERTLARLASRLERRIAWRTHVRFAGGDAERVRAWIGGAADCLPQSEGDLGERLLAAFAAGYAAGATAVVAVGTDCPGAGAADIADAFLALEGADVVFGPARDGGYWLVGVRRCAFPSASGRLFAGIGWGGPDVLAASLEVVGRAGLAPDLLRTLEDVDRPEDLGVWERALRGDGAGEVVSVVIPALDEAGRIGPLVADLAACDGVDVVVADGGSTDGTPAAALDSGARVVRGPRGRAAQMNAGAAAAAGSVLLFLHADTRLPPGWPAAVRTALGAPGVAGGAFSFSTDSPERRMRLVEAAANWRGRRLGILFGDQAIFVRRQLFDSLGGFRELPLMEDYEFVLRLRSRGRVVILPERAVTSARRWERRGLWRTSLTNVALTAAYLAGVSPARLSRWYHGPREHRSGGGS